METVDSFLISDLPGHRRDISDIEDLIVEAQRVYATQFSKSYAWPYDVMAHPGPPRKNLSDSTTAMILAALLRVRGRLASPNANWEEYQWPFAHPGLEKLDTQLSKNLERASKLLLDKIHPSPTKSLTLESSTYGEDDVFTLAWVAKVSTAQWPDSAIQQRWKSVSNQCRKMAEAKLRASRAFENVDALFEPKAGNPGSLSISLAHSLPALRLVQTIRLLKGSKRGPLTVCMEFFERRLHQHLSFSSIPDSRFDPAELMFCLEGMLHSQGNTVDRALFDRVVSVLTEVQEENAFWRPVNPFIAQHQGLVLFPVSVEVANSLLRACTIFDGSAVDDTYGSKCLGLLRRYWQWLKARTVKFQRKGKNGDLVGWHSEHVNDPNLIHLWETSQVLEFLLGFRNLLLTHIGRTMLVRSRLPFRPRVLERASNRRKGAGNKQWDLSSEPAKSLGSLLRVYQRIGLDFIQPRTQGKGIPRYSMLLYGPPGTGKTTTVGKLAEALGLRMISISVSEFLAGGAAQVEARAKAIFEVLEAQPPCVVLFDEIDNFLLDRDSERYSEQETSFQFMTPSMLTKLDDLRRTERVIFVVGTNYEDRIDAAIKRTGRIDRAYLLLPPDAHQRAKQLRALLKLKAGNRRSSAVIGSAFGAQVGKEEWQQLLAESLFLGWRDLEEAVQVVEQSPTRSLSELMAKCKNAPRSCSIEIYRSRFLSVDGTGARLGSAQKTALREAHKTPLGEFLCLVALLLETPRPLEGSEEEVISIAKRLIQLNGAPIKESDVQKYARDLGEAKARRVAKYLNTFDAS